METVYFNTFPEKVDELGGPEDIFLRFEAEWWRYTDWIKPEGKTMLTSDGKSGLLAKKRAKTRAPGFGS